MVNLAEQSFVTTPQLFAEKGFPPIMATPTNLYPDFHVERYVHALPALDSPPLRDNHVIIALKPVSYSYRQGKRFKTGSLSPGNIVMMTQGHHGHWEWQTAVDDVHVRIEPEWLERMAERGDILQTELAEQYSVPDQKAFHTVQTFFHEMQAGCPNGQFFGESLMIALTTHLFAQYGVASTRSLNSRGLLSPIDLRRATDFIQGQLNADLSLCDIADEVGYSPAHFTRLFKASTGQTPFQFVRERRLEQAHSLLRHGKQSIAYIAALTGFADQAHLSREFKKRYGFSPKHLRAKQHA